MKIFTSLALGSGLLAALSACSPRETAAAPQLPNTGYTAPEPLAEHGHQLLSLAAQAAHKFPLNPHIKSRSRAQEAVVMACLELGALDRALACAEEIANWRRGVAFAEYAHARARAGETETAKTFLQRAVEEAKSAAAEKDQQAWRVDCIRGNVAGTYLLLGDVDAAKTVAGKLVDSQIGLVLAGQARVADTAALPGQLKTLDALLKNGNFDQLGAVMDACLVLVDKFYEDASVREGLESRVKKAFAKLPLELRIQRLSKLVEIAAKHKDFAHGKELLAAAVKIFSGNTWTPEHRVPMRARLAALHHKVGESDLARREVAIARKDYDENVERIVNIYRASALRPLAEACHELGDTKQSLSIYRLAVEAGMENPNARPRAKDLSATCCSMARQRVEPDAVLLSRLNQVCNLLSDPW